MTPFYIETEDGLVECIKTDIAAKWIGVDRATLCRSYQEELGAVLVGRQLWWPVDRVLAFDRRKFDGRYKDER